MGISPIFAIYPLVVNISAEKEEDWYVVIGVEESQDKIKTKWVNLSKEVRDGLIAWSKPNKKEIVK